MEFKADQDLAQWSILGHWSGLHEFLWKHDWEAQSDKVSGAEPEQVSDRSIEDQSWVIGEPQSELWGGSKPTFDLRHQRRTEWAAWYGSSEVPKTKLQFLHSTRGGAAGGQTRWIHPSNLLIMVLFLAPTGFRTANKKHKQQIKIQLNFSPDQNSGFNKEVKIQLNNNKGWWLHSRCELWRSSTPSPAPEVQSPVGEGWVWVKGHTQVIPQVTNQLTK